MLPDMASSLVLVRWAWLVILFQGQDGGAHDLPGRAVEPHWLGTGSIFEARRAAAGCERSFEKKDLDGLVVGDGMDGGGRRCGGIFF